MKSLDSLLQSLRLRSTIQNRVVLGEPWGVDLPPHPKAATFQFVEQGEALMTVPGQAPVRMEAGDLAIVFAENGHVMQDVKGTRPIDLIQLLGLSEVICPSGITLQFGGDGPQTSIISGVFGFAESEMHPLWRMLPPYILLKGQDGQATEWLDMTLTLLSRESMAVRPGALAVVDRLCDVLFIQALRSWVRQREAASGLPAAVQDAEIDEALDLMQTQPAEDWTLEKLARRVALSRSTFAERFRRLAGDTPMEYLAHWRMHLASQLLRDGQENVASIAMQVGYESEAAFAKAFKKRMGVAPGAYRRTTPPEQLFPIRYPTPSTSP
jgi:AraC-like DNA-binding protein